MESIRTTTQKIIRDWSVHREDKQQDAIKNNLRLLLTRQEQKHITNCVLNNAQLILKVDSSAWLYQLNLKKGQLLKRLNQTLGPGSEITDVLLRLDRDEAKG